MSTIKKRSPPGIVDSSGTPVEEYARLLHGRCAWCDYDPEVLYENRWNPGIGSTEELMVVFILERDGRLPLHLPYDTLCAQRTVEAMQAYLETEIAIARVRDAE